MKRLALLLWAFALPVEAQVLGDRNTLTCAVLIEGDVDDSLIQDICGLSAAEVGEMMGLALSRNPEDYAELLDRLADLTPDGARLKAESIRSFFRILGQEEIPPDQLRDRLAEIATRHLRLEQELAAFQVADPDIQRQTGPLQRRKSASSPYRKSSFLSVCARSTDSLGKDQVAGHSHMTHLHPGDGPLQVIRHIQPDSPPIARLFSQRLVPSGR